MDRSASDRMMVALGFFKRLATLCDGVLTVGGGATNFEFVTPFCTGSIAQYHVLEAFSREGSCSSPTPQ